MLVLFPTKANKVLQGKPEVNSKVDGLGDREVKYTLKSTYYIARFAKKTTGKIFLNVL